MKLQEHDYGFEAVLPENRTPFKIKTSAKLFDILSSGIYKDKILAVIRELSCNAYDAHICAKKKDTPFKVRLPTRLDPTFYVEDEGTGIDPERITDIYWTYGESSKTDSNDQIGALGLGSKSPFAYTKSSFVVKNRYQGAEYTYLCFINEDGMPDGSCVSEEPTDKPSGVTVEFAVRPDDIYAFHDRTDRFFKRWAAVKPIFVDHKIEEVLKTKIIKVIEGTDWYLEKTDRNQYSDHQGAVALQGNVPYPIEVSSIPQMPKELKIIASNPFIVTFDMGEINFASSREALQYDERTCANIIARLQEVRQEIETSFTAKIFKKGMTQLEFITNFRKTFHEFTTTIKYDGGYGVDTDAWYINMLLGKKKTEAVSYAGAIYPIEDLISGTLKFRSEGHQAFGIFKAAQRSTRSARTFMKQFSMVRYIARTDIDGVLIHPTWNVGSTIKSGEKLDFEWKNAAIPKRAELTDYFRVLKIADKFDVISKNTLPIDEANITFFVNDVGNAGEARYRAFINRINNQAFFVNFDARVSSVDVVTEELKELIKNGMSGAKIELVSSQPDYRPSIEKEKIEAGTMRVKLRNILFEKNDSDTQVADGNINVKVKDIARIAVAEEVLKIADLQAEPFVLYVVKRRSPTALYDDVNSHQDSIIENKQVISLAAKYLLSDAITEIPSDTKRPNAPATVSGIRLLVLNEGQIEWLKKRKVVLVGLRTLIAERIAAMETAELFREKIERASALKRIGNIANMYDAVSGKPAKRDRLTYAPGSSSFFKELFAEYTVLNAKNNSLAEQYAKLKIFEAVKGAKSLGTAITEDLNNRLNKTYPMLRMINLFRFTAEGDLGIIIDYIEQMDAI